MSSRLLTGGGAQIGLPYRIALEPEILRRASAGTLAFCEVHVESLSTSARVRDFVDTLACCGVPVVLHSTKLQFGSGIFDQLDEVRRAFEVCHVMLLSGHIASGMTSTPYGEGFTHPDYSKAFCDSVIYDVEIVTREIGCHVGLENVAVYGSEKLPQLDEISFLDGVCSRTNSSVVFDLSNFLSSCKSRTIDDTSLELLLKLPIAYLHISGGRWVDGTYYDTHCDPIPIDHLRTLRKLVRKKSFPVLYERDGRFDLLDEIDGELSILESVLGSYKQIILMESH